MKINKAISLVVLLFVILSVSCSPKEEALQNGLYAKFDTNRGSFTAMLEYDKAPLTVANFVSLADGTSEYSRGRPFYDGLLFHRVEPGFVIQGGDPAGNGTGNAGFVFPDEFHPDLKHSCAGILGMANSGPDTNSCQFYITLDKVEALDDAYSVFGLVVRGMNVVNSIKVGDKINKVSIIRVGKDAENFDTSHEAWLRYYDDAQIGMRIRELARREGIVKAIKTKWPQLKETHNGFLESIEIEGKGDRPYMESPVTVNYTGWLPNGQMFDQNNKPEGFNFSVGIGQVIGGWDLIVRQMKKGEKRLVAIPPEYGYGAQGISGVIPPNSYLIFEITLVDFEK